MVWRTNFDQQISQLSQETRQINNNNNNGGVNGKVEITGQKSSSSSSSSIGSNNGGGVSKSMPQNEVIHAANNIVTSVMPNSLTQRDQQSSPLTIPLNESMTLHGCDDINMRELDPTTAAIMQATQSSRGPSRVNNGLGVNKPAMSNGKKTALPTYTNLPNSGTSNSILKKANSTASTANANSNEFNFASISYMFEQLVGQMDILSQVFIEF